MPSTQEAGVEEEGDDAEQAACAMHNALLRVGGVEVEGGSKGSHRAANGAP